MKSNSNVVQENELEWYEEAHGPRFTARRKHFGLAAGGELSRAAVVTARRLSPQEAQQYACVLEVSRLLPGGLASIPPAGRARRAQVTT